MKKFKAIILIFVLAAVLMTGCSETKNENKETLRTAPPASENGSGEKDNADSKDADKSDSDKQQDDVEKDADDSKGSEDIQSAPTKELTVKVNGKEEKINAKIDTGDFSPSGGPWFDIYVDLENYVLSRESGYRYSLENTDGHAYLEVNFLKDMDADEFAKAYMETYKDSKLKDNGEVDFTKELKARHISGSNAENSWNVYMLDSNDGVLYLTISTSEDNAEENTAKLMAMAETIVIK